MDFHIIEMKDKDGFEELVSHTPYENSEFSFANIFIWRQVYRIKAACKDGVLYIKGACPGLGNDIHYQPIVPANMPLDQVISEIKHDMGGQAKIYAANKQFVQRIERENINCSIKKNRDMFDYVYLADDLANLSGKKYHKKRTHINKFMRTYEYSYKELTPEFYNDCIEVFDRWAENIDDDCSEEKEAVVSALNNMEDLGLCGALIYIGVKPVAFTIGEHFREDMALIHIEKAVPDVQEAYGVINQQFVINKWQGNVKYINREEDMGLPGLRIAKMGYRPCRFIEKYNIEF